MDDIDVKGVMEREKFAEMCEPLFENLQKVIQRAFDGCGARATCLSAPDAP